LKFHKFTSLTYLRTVTGGRRLILTKA